MSPRRLKPSTPKPPAKRSPARRASLAKLLAHPAVKPAKLPTSVQVELATLVKQAPPGEEWLHEIKFDGYRMVCRIEKGRARFISRNGKDWSDRFPELTACAAKLGATTALLDGEVVAIGPDGVTHFQMLQNIFQSGRTKELVYYVFDILHLNGHDVRGLPLELRKEIARRVVARGRQRSIRYSDHLAGTGPEVFAGACRMHLEGIVSKRRDSPYRAGRGLNWLKVKCSHREEFVVGGFTPPGGSRAHFGAILVGYYQGKKLVYAGRVGTGFDDRALAELHAKFQRLERSTSPFVKLQGTSGQARGVHWLKPQLVAEVEFSNWTDEGLLRHPSFQGLREDKRAQDVVREVAAR